MVANDTAFTSGRDLPSVAENVELLTGQRGNQLDKAVTYRDLESLGVATLSRIGSNYKATANPALSSSPGVVDFPTKPKNVIANGAFNTILIEWDEPDYRGHEYAEVWRSATDNLSIAVKIGTSSARMYSDPIGGDAKVYYWVRFINSKDDVGPFNSSNGTYAETAVNVQQLLDSLQGQIEESQLAAALTEKIGIIDVNATSIQQITVDLSSLSDRQAQAEAILKAAQDTLGSTTINVSLLHDELSQLVQKYSADVQSLRDAVFTVNPVTGEITSDALAVERNERISSINQVTQRIAAAEGVLSQKASSVDVELQRQRLTTVESQMDSINGQMSETVSKATFDATSEDVTQLTNRMTAAEGAITSKATQQSVDDVSQRVSNAEQQLSVVNDDLQSKAQQINQISSAYQQGDQQNSSAIAELSQTVSDNNTATAQQMQSLGSSLGELNSSVTELQQAVTGDNGSLAGKFELLQARANAAAISAANAALSDDETARNNRKSEATIKHDQTVLANEQEAQAKTIDQISADLANTEQTLSAQITDAKTVSADAVQALAQTVATVESELKAADLALGGRITDVSNSVASGDAALAQRVTQVEATAQSDKSTLQALIQQEASTRAGVDGVQAQQIATAQATANNLTASVQTQSQAISALQGGAQAMWTAKAQVGDITTGIGLMTDSNGKSQVMISASQLFVFDPNSAAPTASIFAVSGGKVVIQKAVIEAATIETITSMSITADYVRAGVSISSPVIVGGSLSIGSGDNSLQAAGGSLAVGKGGAYSQFGYNWHTVIYSDGSIYTDRLYAANGTFTGTVNANAGIFNNVTINENCDVKGTIYANKIVGDVVAAKFVTPNQTYTLDASSLDRYVYAIVKLYSSVWYPTGSWGGATDSVALYVDGTNVDSASVSAFAGNGQYATATGTGLVSHLIPAGVAHTISLSKAGMLFAVPVTTGSIY